MEFKENTKKPKYSFKKSCGSSNLDFVKFYDFKGNVDGIRHLSSIDYYAINEEEYNELKPQLEMENEALVNVHLHDIIKKYPILVNNKRKKKDIDEFKNSDDYNTIIDSMVQIILSLGYDKIPIITELIYLYKKKECSEHPERITINLNTILKINIEDNHNLKHLFKIHSSTEADYILRKHQHWSKSHSHHEDKSRKWRSIQETDRRRKERRENKQLCN
jgi:hypothetical protein